MWPYSISSTFNDDIICADSFEHRLLVFSREFIFKYQIGDTKGNALGQFDEPVDLVINEIGKLFVADKNNYRVQIFVEQKKSKEVKTAKFSQGVSESDTSKIYKHGSDFIFKDVIRLVDKPVKLTAAPLAPIIGVATENGSIFLINEKNQITAYLQVKTPFDIIDLKNICLNESGDQLICLKSSERNLYLNFYKIEQKETAEEITSIESSFTNTITNTNKSYSKEKNKTVITNMKLFKKVKLDPNYFPGIYLTKSLWIKLSLDFQYLIMLDSVNSNLLEYDLNGKFSKILIKAEERLGNVLAIDFSGDRQHMVAVEFEIDTNKSLTKNFDSISANYRKIGLSTKEIRLRNRSASYVFKLKLYRYRDCECHRHLDSRNRNKLNKSAGFNHSLNNYSSDSESANFTHFKFLNRK